MGIEKVSDLELRVAKAIYLGLKAKHGGLHRYVSGEPDPSSPEMTTIDGDFCLIKVARQVLAALPPQMVAPEPPRQE